MKRRLLVLFFIFASCTSAFADSTAFDIVISAGSPQIGNGDYTTTGSTFFVDSGSSYRCDAANCGTYDKPFATLDYAIGRTTANNGDIIFVAPGHTQSITAADGWDADVAGIRIVGLGEGNDRPSFTFADTDATVAIGAANVTVENFRFLAGISEVVTGISIEAAGDNFTLKNCEFPEPSTSTFEFDKAIVLASGADRFIADHIISYRSAATGATSFIDVVAGVVDRLTITNSVIVGEYSNAPIYSDQINTNVYIDNNIVANLTNGQFAVEFTAAATGAIRNTALRTDAQATALDPGSLDFFNVTWCSDTTADAAEVPVLVAADGTANILGADNSNNSFASTNTVANEDGSIIERLEQVQEAVNNGTGTSIGTNKSVVDLLGTTGAALVDDALSVVGIMGVNDADNAFASGSVVPNVDGSLLERNEAALANGGISRNHPNYLAVATGTFDTTGTWSTVAAHEVATVTGCVRMTIIPECTASVSSVGDTGTIALGDETTTNSIIAASTLGAGTMATGELWVDATLTRTILTRTQLNAVEFAVCNGKDIGYTVATNALSGGSMTFHIWWTPLDATGAVAAGAGGAL